MAHVNVENERACVCVRVVLIPHLANRGMASEKVYSTSMEHRGKLKGGAHTKCYADFVGYFVHVTI